MRISVNGIVGATTGEALVQLELNDPEAGTYASVVIAADEAREIAMSLLECAEASVHDLFLVEYAQNPGGFSVEKAAQLLEAFRDWRDKRYGEMEHDDVPTDEPEKEEEERGNKRGQEPDDDHSGA